jgi:hypothetical protein
MLLDFRVIETYHEAQLGTPDDGVRFTINDHPTCYRRGRYKLLIEVCGGENHHKWGCFDEQDQPARWFHNFSNAVDEAQRIAVVLLTDRNKKEPKIIIEDIEKDILNEIKSKIEQGIKEAVISSRTGNP